MLTVVCGMPQEAAIAKAAFPASVPILSGTAKLNLSSLVPADCDRILSFGLCGGLAPPLGIGAVVAATTLTDGAGNVAAADARWTKAIVAAARDAVTPSMRDVGEQYDLAPATWNAGFQACAWYSSGILDQADTAVQRAQLLVKTGAWAIDDESFYVAKLAAARGIPFAIVRSVSDDAGETLPLAARGAIMNADGSANINYLLRSLAADPSQTFDLFKIAVEFNTSLCTLQAAAAALAPILTA